ELPPNSANKVFFIPELLAGIMCAVKHSYADYKNAQESIRLLRLVSRAFCQAAEPHFTVYMDISPFAQRRSIVKDYRIFELPLLNGDDDYNREDESRTKIRVCGPYIRSLNLRTDGYHTTDILDALGDHCLNVEEITLSFLEYPTGKISQPDYLRMLEKWTLRNNVKRFTASMALQTKNAHGRANFEGQFDKVQKYLPRIDSFCIKVENPYARATDKDPDVSRFSINWQTFKGFFQSFTNLKSFDMSGIHIAWSQMPPAAKITTSDSEEDDNETPFPNLTEFTLHRGGLDLSIISRINLMFPKLESLSIQKLVSAYDGDGYDYVIDNDVEGEEEGDGPSLSTEVAKDPAKMTVTKIHIQEANADDLYELLKVAPALKNLTCHQLQVQGNPKESQEDLFAALRPFNHRPWDSLDLGSLGTFKGKELKEFLPLNLSTLSMAE
ncbi:hypothetical protein BGX27_000957, partial [Mortierella sp. AM989]